MKKKNRKLKKVIFSEVKEKIDSIRSSSKDFEEMRSCMHKLARITQMSLGSICGRGTDLYRATSHHTSIPNRIEDLWHPPTDKITNYGRANCPGQSMFYCSSDPNGAFKELRVDDGNVVVLSKWRVKRDFYLQDIGYSEDALKTLKSDRVVSQNYKKFEGNLKSEESKLVRKYLEEVFISNSQDDYLITSALASMLTASDGEIAGLKYPSMLKNGNVDNLALLPEFVPSHLFLYESHVVLLDTVVEGANGEISGNAIASMTREVDGNIKWELKGVEAKKIGANEEVQIQILPGQRKTLGGAGIIILNGKKYSIKPGYTIELLGSEILIRDLAGNKINPH